MKKFLGICLIVSSIIVSGSLIYVTYIKKNSVREEDLTLAKNTLAKNPGFVWGVNTSAYQFDGYVPETAQKQIGLINELGANTIRMTLERKVTSLDPFTTQYDETANDGFVDKLAENKKDIVMIVDGDIIGTADQSRLDQEAAGYQMGRYAAQRYKGKVKYFQLANEVTGTVIKPSDPSFTGKTFKGDYDIEYSKNRYDSLLGWLTGLQKGVKEANPEAKIVITGHWHLYFIIDKLIKDGINPDVIGWAWYSSDGLDITKRDLGAGKDFNLIEKLKSFGKPVWIVETNSTKGSYNEKTKKVDQNYQAEFFKEFIPNLLSTGQVDGIFAFPLFDSPIFVGTKDDSEAHWGLVEVKKDSSGKPSFTTKKAFDVFHHFITAD